LNIAKNRLSIYHNVSTIQAVKVASTNIDSILDPEAVVVLDIL
jgi:hypothetical protein